MNLRAPSSHNPSSAIILVALAVALWLLPACSEHPSTSLGSSVTGAPVPVASIGQASPGSRVVLQGHLVKKCPVAGCWFILQDETGTIKVDTKNAGFVVVEVPINAPLVVAGRVQAEGDERFIDALGVRF